jgi:hypothetical protein
MLHDFFLHGYSKYTRNLGGGFYIWQNTPARPPSLAVGVITFHNFLWYEIWKVIPHHTRAGGPAVLGHDTFFITLGNAVLPGRSPHTHKKRDHVPAHKGQGTVA